MSVSFFVCLFRLCMAKNDYSCLFYIYEVSYLAPDRLNKSVCSGPKIMRFECSSGQVNHLGVDNGIGRSYQSLKIFSVAIDMDKFMLTTSVKNKNNKI